jgi:hypothetical protein
MLALVEIVQQVRLLSLLAHGDPLAVTIRDQCLAALDGNHSEALAFLTKLRDDELSRPDIVVAAVWQIQQAVRFVESKSLSSMTDCYLCAKGASRRAMCACRIARRILLCVAKRNAHRNCAFAGATFLVFAGWPASALALTITAILCALAARQCQILQNSR